jgi:hypothetical protein|nr:MAG TPA: bacteriocin [Crassvirales sp.]
MAKKKIIRKSNRTLNLFADGGDTKQTWGQQAKSSAQSAFSGQNLGSTIGGIDSAVGTIVNAGIQNAQIADTSDLEGEIKQAQTYTVQANNNDDLMSEWGMFSPMENVSWKDIRGGSTGQRIGNTIGAAGSGAAAGASVGGPIGAIVGGVVGLGSAIGGWLGGNRKAKKKAKKFNKQIDAANEKNMVALEDKAGNIDTQNDLNMLANFSAYGGPINIFGSGAIDYELAKEDLYNKQLSAMSKYKMSSMPNSFETPELAVFAKGGKIHIKKANRGKFTDYCGGKVTSECIARGKRSSSPTIRKRATFAANARKWKHEDGGPLDSLVADINRRSNADFVKRLQDPNRDYIQDWATDNIATHKLSWATDDNGAIVFPNVQRINGKLYDFTDPANKRGEWDALDSAIERGDTLRMTPSQAKEFTETYKKYYPKGKTFRAEGGPLFTHGGIWDNGLTYINEGGSHEENPFEGVQMGVDPQGIPNLVEEGEVVYNDYVFSNRMKVPKDVKKRLKIRGDTFAEAAKELSKESEERPNDPISKRGLISAMTRLQQAQEQVRMEENRGGNKYAHGGKIGRKYDGEGDEPNLLQFYTPQERWLRTLQRQGVVPTYELPAFQKPYSMMTPEERTASFNLKVPSLVDTRTPAERWMDENIKPIQFNPPAITGDTGSDADTEDPDTNSSRPRQKRGASWLRYAPVVGAGLGVLTDALGWTNSPDYGNADLVGSAVDNLTNVEFTPIGNYLTYRPLDRNYYINKLNAQAGATRRAIVNQSGGNRATALAGLLAADYNAQSALGDLARQAEEYNFNQRKDVETFNRGTNQFNSEMGLKASIANQANDKLRLQARTTQAQLRDQVDARASAGRAANLTNLFDSLGEIGREEFSRNMIQTNPALYYSIDSSGRITYKNGYEDLSEAEKKVVRDAANKAKGKKKAKGGYLTIRKGK